MILFHLNIALQGVRLTVEYLFIYLFFIFYYVNFVKYNILSNSVKSKRKINTESYSRIGTKCEKHLTWTMKLSFIKSRKRKVHILSQSSKEAMEGITHSTAMAWLQSLKTQKKTFRGVKTLPVSWNGKSI